MSNTKHIINIFGPSTAGKSTVASLLREHIEGLYTVDFDIIKRQLTGYYWKRDSATCKQLTLDALAAATKAGLPILLLYPPLTSKDEFEVIAAIAEARGYTLLNLEITAPKEVLIARYEDRLQRVRESGTNWKFKTLAEFKATLGAGYFKPDGATSITSHDHTPDEIFGLITSLMSRY
jgi:adenylate kinase family enzyme